MLSKATIILSRAEALTLFGTPLVLPPVLWPRMASISLYFRFHRPLMLRILRVSGHILFTLRA